MSLSRTERPDGECKVPSPRVPEASFSASLALNLGIANKSVREPSPSSASLGARRFAEVGSEFEGSCLELLLLCQSYLKGSLKSDSVLPGVCSELLTSW